MELHVNHATTFQYAGPVQDSVNEVRLHPITDARQVCLDFRLTTAPVSDIRTYTDYFGNIVHTFDVGDPHTSLAITARSRVTTHGDDLPPDLTSLPDRYTPLSVEAAGELLDFLQPTARADFDPQIIAFAEQVCDHLCAGHEGSDPPLGALAWGISHALHERFEYVPGATDVGTPAGKAFAARRGVCQDYTHVVLAALRWLRIPARYTSGYFQMPSARAGAEVGEQASHAWVEVWFPSQGWVGLDPTNDRPVDEGYIRVAYGRDYADVAPVKGSYRGAETRALDVDVSVSSSGAIGRRQQQQPQQ